MIAIFTIFITIGTRIKKPSARLQKKGLKSDFYSGFVLSLLDDFSPGNFGHLLIKNSVNFFIRASKTSISGKSLFVFIL